MSMSFTGIRLFESLNSALNSVKSQAGIKIAILCRVICGKPGNEDDRADIDCFISRVDDDKRKEVLIYDTGSIYPEYFLELFSQEDLDKEGKEAPDAAGESKAEGEDTSKDDVKILKEKEEEGQRYVLLYVLGDGVQWGVYPDLSAAWDAFDELKESSSVSALGLYTGAFDEVRCWGESAESLWKFYQCWCDAASAEPQPPFYAIARHPDGKVDGETCESLDEALAALDRMLEDDPPSFKVLVDSRLQLQVHPGEPEDDACRVLEDIKAWHGRRRDGEDEGP
mmetsp:Transcript_63489/g.149113  ORF Transcript_63489/g.149113 Transcript_63489/m.149113 type:complete len:282 (+) Transcript_63489:1-846(+)